MANDNRQIKVGDAEVTLVLPNWFGFEHKAVSEHFGDLTYIASMTIKSWPYAVYKANNPDRTKGHKDYVILAHQSVGNRTLINGLTPEEMEEYRFQDGKLCEDCNEVIYSVERHDYRTCSCGKVMVDGGRDYFRASLDGQEVRIDFLNMEILV